MTPDDLQRIGASSGWRARRTELVRGTSVGDVVVKGQRAPRPAWRYWLLKAAATALGEPLLRAAPAHGGARAQAIEVRRLRALRAAGLPVPEVLHVADDFFVQRWLGAQTLDGLLHQDDEAALVWWQRGLHGLVAVHQRDQALSQAFTRNFVVHGDALAMIDFEDDPLEVLSLPQAQARDWLAYLHSTARELAPAWLARTGTLAPLLREALAQDSAAVRQQVRRSARRLGWVRRLPLDRARGRRGWRRHLLILQDAVGLMLAAADPSGPSAESTEVSHARHH